MKTISILVACIAILAISCSHDSKEDTGLVIPSTFTTLSEADLESMLEAIEEDGILTEEAFSMIEPNSPIWNTLVIQTAEGFRPSAIEYNQCFTSLDVFYDFENSDITPIEKSIELSLRYSFEFSAIVRWWTSFELLSISTEQYEALVAIDNEDSSEPEENTVDFEEIRPFYEEVRLSLSGILGDTSLQSLLENFAYETLPALKQGFSDIGFESSSAEISKFQAMWAANPEMERIVRIYLGLIEITESRLVDLLRDTTEVSFVEFSDFYFSLWEEFYGIFNEDDLNPLSKGIADEALVSLSENEEYKRIASGFLEPLAKQSAPTECLNPEFP